VLAARIEGVETLRMLVLGGGNAGVSAAGMAAALDCEVRLLDIDPRKLATLAHEPSLAGVSLERFREDRLPELMAGADVLIGAALVPGARAPCVIDGAMLARMPARAVFIDIAIDQGGMSTSSRPTSYAEPVYLAHGVIHCCLPNLPSCVARSSTQALTRATLPYVCRLADLGVRAAVMRDPALRAGLNVDGGRIVHPAVARALAQ